MKAKSDQPREYASAMLLPDSHPAQLLHRYAADVFERLGGVHLEGIVETGRAMRERWLHDLDRAGEEGFRPFVGTREAARMAALVEKILPKINQLRDEAYRVARVKVFHETGQRLEFANYLEFTATAPSAETPAPAPTVDAPQPEPASSTAPAGDDLATKGEIKSILHKLYERGVVGKALRDLKDRCKAGDITRAQLAAMDEEMLRENVYQQTA
jgi:hypothetical protein